MQPQGQKPRVKRFSTPPSIDQWLTHSIIVPMASGPDDSSVDDTSSSLGDSTYDFLDDKSGFTTDDEETGNLAHSISSSDAHDSELPTINQSQNTARPARSSNKTTQVEHNDEVATEGEHEKMDFEHSDIKLDEPLRISPNAARTVEGSHTLRIFDKLETKDIVSMFGTQNPPSQLKATVRQTMAGSTLSLGRPFGMFFVGDTAAKDTIIQKIGSALTASTNSGYCRSESPRFNVVPISSFGETTSPEVLLVDSLGIEVRVDHCSSATFSRKDDGNDSISLRFSNEMTLTSTWSSNESRFTVSSDFPGWELPQVALFYLSDTESMSAKQTRRFARSFMNRHKVPCLIITQSQLWNRPAEALTLDYMTPHLCLETSGLDHARPRVLKRLPIDLATFLNLDAVQINRNLACLVDARTSAKTEFLELSTQKSGNAKHDLIADESGCCSTRAAGKYSAWKDFVLEKVRSCTRSPIPVSMLLALGISFLVLGHYFAYPNANGSTLQTVKVSSLDQLKPIVSPKVVNLEPTVTSSLVPTAPQTTASFNANANIQSNTDLTAWLLDSQSLTPNNSAKFKVHVVGDRHIVLRPPHWFMRYRKAPKLIFNVTRKNEAIDHELSMLFDGVYALKVSREEAFGTLDVSVRTASKPKINETFQVDFGNSWLRAASWRNAGRTVADSLRGDIELVQTSLSLIYNHSNTEVQRAAQEVAKKALAIRQSLDRVKSASLRRTAATTDLVLARTKGLSQTVSSKFGYRSAILSRQLSLHSQHVRNDLNQFARNKTAAVKETIRTWSRAANSINLTAATTSIRHLQQDHLRSAQKRALKVWWRLAGMPKQVSGRTTADGSQRKSGLRPKRTGNE